MTYGLQIKNSNNEIVIDDEHPVFVFERQFSVSSSVFGTWNGTTNRKLNAAFPPNDKLYFFQLPVGGRLSEIDRALNNGTPYELETNLTSVTFIECSITSVSASTGGYGMAVFNQSGNPVFVTNELMLPVRDVLTLNFTPTVFATAREWFCIPQSFSALFQNSTIGFFYAGTGVERVTSNTIRCPLRSGDQESPAQTTFDVFTM